MSLRLDLDKAFFWEQNHRQHWPPALAPLASKMSQNQFPKTQPRRMIQFDSGWFHSPVVTIPTRWPGAADGFVWKSSLWQDDMPACDSCFLPCPSLHQAFGAEALLCFFPRRSCSWKFDVNSSTWEKLQDILKLRSHFEQTKSTAVWFEVTRCTCLSHLPLSRLVLWASRPHLI